MMKYAIRYVLFAIVAVLASVYETHACSCASSGPPCQSFWQADAVFSATVVSKSVTTIDGGIDLKRKEQQVAVKLLVEDVFRGGLGGNDIEVITGMGGGDCGYNFEKGKKYLVYAYEHQNKLHASICSRTRLLSEAAADLAYFRNLPREDSGASILVKVIKRVPGLNENSNYDVKPMEGVRIIAEAGDQKYEGKTNASGQYEFKQLPPGKYKVTSDLPKTSRNHWQTEVTVEDRSCAGVEFWNNVEGTIKGTVFDEHGNQARGVKIDLIDLADSVSGSPDGRWRYSTNEGNYELHNIPPGKYLLGVNLIGAPSSQCPRVRTLYSNPNSAIAGYVEINQGEELLGYDIRLLPGGVERTIEGIVVWPNGKPAVRASVRLANGSEPYFGIGDPNGVDAQGRFVLKGIEGCRYRVYAFTYGGRISSTSNEIEETRHAEPVTVTLTNQPAPTLRLVLTSPGFIHEDNERNLRTTKVSISEP
jgi:Carboxypeptidase regulatory-like domain/Tissue inhibitor of metalloproteinase